jgi:hypothetical protein
MAAGGISLLPKGDAVVLQIVLTMPRAAESSARSGPSFDD